MDKVYVLALTSSYRLTHGREPRGSGLWHFTIDAGGYSTTFAATGTYSVAKAAAKRVAREFAREHRCSMATIEVGG